MPKLIDNRYSFAQTGIRPVRLFGFLVVLLLVLTGRLGAQSPPEPARLPAEYHFVYDDDQRIDTETEWSINRFLADLQLRTEADARLITVATTGRVSPAEFIERQRKQWNSPPITSSKSIVVIVVRDSEHILIDVAPTLDDVVSPEWSESLSKRVQVDFFAHQRDNDGLHLLMAAIANRIADDRGILLQSAPGWRHDVFEINWWIVIGILVILTLACLAIRRQLRIRREYRWDHPLDAASGAFAASGREMFGRAHARTVDRL